jgi:hypothetical protein
MSRLTLDSCWAKVTRAREHTHELEQLEERFLKRRPNQVSFDKKSEPPWVIVRAVVEPIPLVFSTIAGDVVQNLRSALDHLAWQLVLSEGSTPGRHTTFPISLTKPDFDEWVRNPPKNRLSPLDGIEVDGEKWALVEGAQPYNWPGAPQLSSLGALKLLSNRDKHQSLMPGVSFVHDFDPLSMMEVVGLEISDIQVTFKGGDVLTHNAEIARFKPTAEGSMEMKGEFPFDITFSDREPTDPMALATPVGAFDRFRSEIVGIIRAFERFFP